MVVIFFIVAQGIFILFPQCLISSERTFHRSVRPLPHQLELSSGLGPLTLTETPGPGAKQPLNTVDVGGWGFQLGGIPIGQVSTGDTQASGFLGPLCPQRGPASSPMQGCAWPPAPERADPQHPAHSGRVVWTHGGTRCLLVEPLQAPHPRSPAGWVGVSKLSR